MRPSRSKRRHTCLRPGHVALPAERLRRGRPAYSSSLYTQSRPGASDEVVRLLPMPKPSIGAADRMMFAIVVSSMPPLAKIVTSVNPPSSRMRRTDRDSAIRSPLSRRTPAIAIPAALSRGASATTLRAAASVS